MFLRLIFRLNYGILECQEWTHLAQFTGKCLIGWVFAANDTHTTNIRRIMAMASKKK